MTRSVLQRWLPPIVTALALLAPVPSRAFVQGRYATPDVPALSVPLLPIVADQPDTPVLAAISDSESVPDHADTVRRFQIVTV
jgi:hypothetical protein